MTENEIICSTWIQARIEQIWQAVNEPEQLAQWLFPPFLNAQMRRTNDDKAIMLMGPMEVPFMVFEASEPPHQVTIRGFPDKVLKATFRLEAENGGTAVAVIMSGFETLPEGAYEDRLGPSRDGWQKALENLKAFTSGAELPFPQGYIASLLGYRLEREAKYAVERSIWLKASQERVWQAITDPQQIQQWYSPAAPWRLTALEVGGKYTIYDAETDREAHAQIIEMLDPLHHLVLRSMPQSDDEVHDMTTYTLIPEGDGTRLIIVNAGYEVDAVRHQSMEQNAFGFGMALENLQAFLAGEDLPYPFGF